MLEQFINTLLQAVIAVAVPIIAAHVTKWVKAKAAEAAAKASSNKARVCLQEVAEAVATAVTFTSQTYVDALKGSDAFTVENQKEALAKAKEKAAALISQSTADFLNMAYKDAAGYLEAKIEQEVRLQKQGFPPLHTAIAIEE